MRWQDRITSTPDILHVGQAAPRRHAHPGSLILGYLVNGASGEDIQRDLPDVQPEDVTACLAYARDLTGYEVAA